MTDFADWQAEILAAIERGEQITIHRMRMHGKHTAAVEAEAFDAFLREIGHHPDQVDPEVPA